VEVTSQEYAVVDDPARTAERRPSSLLVILEPEPGSATGLAGPRDRGAGTPSMRAT
jgi:hypothetical protein